MASSVLDTESGRAMMLNMAMSQADIHRLFGHSEMLRMLEEPWPHWCHYRVRHGSGRPSYCPPTSFGFLGGYGPSDCDFMVPGTWER